MYRYMRNMCSLINHGIVTKRTSLEDRGDFRRGRARTIFECGLLDSVNYWTTMSGHPGDPGHLGHGESHG